MGDAQMEALGQLVSAWTVIAGAALAVFVALYQQGSFTIQKMGARKDSLRADRMIVYALFLAVAHFHRSVLGILPLKG